MLRSTLPSCHHCPPNSCGGDHPSWHHLPVISWFRRPGEPSGKYPSSWYRDILILMTVDLPSRGPRKRFVIAYHNHRKQLKPSFSQYMLVMSQVVIRSIAWQQFDRVRVVGILLGRPGAPSLGASLRRSNQARPFHVQYSLHLEQLPPSIN